MKRRLFRVSIFGCIAAAWLGLPSGLQAQLPVQSTEAHRIEGETVIEWFGYQGRTYFIQVSDASDPLRKWTWAPVIEAGNEGLISYEFGGDAPRGFARLQYTDEPKPESITLEDWDIDGDGLSNKDEIEVYQTNPLNPDTDDDGLTDGEESTISTDPNDPDSDDDGITDGGESDQGTDPNNASETPLAEWFIFSGDAPEDEIKQRSRTLTIPAGETRLVLVAVASDEYLEGWTDPLTSNEFNDTVAWTITPATGTGMSKLLDVNEHHDDWVIAEIEGASLKGFSPIYVADDGFFTAPEGSPLTLDVSLSATNIGDGQLPSTIIVGVLPISVEVDDPMWTGANELRIAKWENAWVTSTGTFRTDFIDADSGKEPDRFRVRVATDELPSPLDVFFLETIGADAEEHNDDPTQFTIELDAGSPGLGIPSEGYVSNPMILVSDTIDNAFLNSNSDNDQTHIASLGSTIQFRSKAANGKTALQRPVNSRATVEIESIIITPNGNIDAALGITALSDIEQAREIYAQAGIEVLGTVEFVAVPSGVDLSDGLLLDTTQAIGQLSSEALALLNAIATPVNQTDIRAIYVASEILTAQTASGTARGMAFPFGWSNGSNFQRTFLVSLEAYEKTVWSHELGHILLDGEGGHSSRPGNLMQAMASFSTNSGSYTFDTRRLTEEQEATMFSKGVIQINP